MKVEMIALKPMFYGKSRRKGEKFPVEQAHVKLLTAVKSARLVESKPEEERKTYKRRDMRPER